MPRNDRAESRRPATRPVKRERGPNIGLALFVVPVLALIDQSFIPGPMLLAGAVLALLTAYRERTSIDAPALRNSLIGLAIGTVVGACMLKFASGANLDRTFGVLVLLAVLLSVSGDKFDATRRSLIFAGGAAGVMGVMVGIHGPPISLVFQNSEPRVARAMLGAFFSMAYLGGCRPRRIWIVWVSPTGPLRNPVTWRRHWSCCRPAARASHRRKAPSSHDPRHRGNQRYCASSALVRYWASKRRPAHML